MFLDQTDENQIGDNEQGKKVQPIKVPLEAEILLLVDDHLHDPNFLKHLSKNQNK
jgi:hypothetical protein